MLSRKDKNIIRYGTFMERTYLLIDHFDDKSKRWILEARKYFHRCNPNLFKSLTFQKKSDIIADDENSRNFQHQKGKQNLQKDDKIIFIKNDIVSLTELAKKIK